MALTRKFLKNMGIDDDKIEGIIEAHTETVDALKEQRDGYKVDAEKLTEVQKELDDLKAAKDSGDTYEGKYKDLKSEFDTYKKGVEEKETTSKKESLYKALLKECGVSDKRIDSVLKVTNLAGLKLDKEGNLEDTDTLKEDIKKEWSDFIVKENPVPADVPNPPTGGGKSYKNKAEIMAIKDAGERQKAIADNIDMFKKGD